MRCNLLITVVVALINVCNGKAQESNSILTSYKEKITSKPDSQGPNSKVWNIKKTDIIRINLVEMSGELSLHRHPDAEHSLVVLEGKVKAQVGEEIIILEKGDFISIPKNVPHKYWSLAKKSYLMSMDAPYYDPAKTVRIKE